MQKDGRVLYLTEGLADNQYFNVPIANTTVLLLGNGTSITQAAIRLLAQAGVVIGFSGGGGTPLYMGSEIEWLTPQGEYRPTQYLQGWLQFWFDENQRLIKAKTFQQNRIEYLKKVWGKDRCLAQHGFDVNIEVIQSVLDRFAKKNDNAATTTELLLTEAQLTKSLYKHAVSVTGLSEFSRKNNKPGKVNDFLNHGNYLAYGIAACCLWVLGIPHGFAVMHGKTRRGALVFDVADLIKDSLVLPWAFICSQDGSTQQEFRAQILQSFTDHKALNFMFETVKGIAMTAQDPEVEYEQ